MAWRKELQNNKPFVNAILSGLLYFLFFWSWDFSEAMKTFSPLMFVLPGITFPFTTCNYENIEAKHPVAIMMVHLSLSLAIYFGAVWLYSAEGRIDYISILAGFLGSLLFMLLTKYLLNKEIALQHIILVAIISGLAFIPQTINRQSVILLGVAVFIWTVSNGFLLNDVQHKDVRS
ncbi:MAG: hypothetical protein RL660_1705 [Bacteroidota bacterium]|jgi:hypothetical protein